MVPDQAPVAVQEVALAEDHVRVEVFPEATEIGFAERASVGKFAGGGVCVGEGAAPLPVGGPIYDFETIKLSITCWPSQIVESAAL